MSEDDTLGMRARPLRVQWQVSRKGAGSGVGMREIRELEG